MQPDKLKSWVLAARPKTLPAAFVPVIVGSSAASFDGKFNLLAAIVALICSLLIQIGTNFSNDLYDYLKGADGKTRKGPMRVLASGLVSIKEMQVAITLVFGLTFFIGLYLVWLGGTIILIIGILSILSGMAYTAGPFPLAYNGLGDLFVFIFFGFVGTVGTYYVHTLEITMLPILASIPVGGLITNILVVNNYRDIDEDRITGKNTLAVIFGKTFSKVQYVMIIIVSYVIPVILYILFKESILIFLPLITLPLAVKLIFMLNTMHGKELNKTLELSAKLSAAYGILLAAGLLL